MSDARDLDLAPVFAQPVERELARVFDEHGIAWQYEPHTFVLRARAGRVRPRGLLAGFCLPELGVYVECTVMRQARTNRKRRKANRARQHLGITVQILYRRDFGRLARTWRPPALARAARTALAEV